jgi:hypothetical protein
MSENQIYTIEIPDVHPSLNSWTKMHYMARNNLKQEWKQMVYILGKEAKLPKFTKPVEVYIKYFHPRDDVDLDNYTPKFILDGLKEFFVDDNIQHLKKLGWEFKRGKKRSVVEIRNYRGDST